jgi:hypothetical protein
VPEVPRGALVRYHEWYGWNGKPNEGLKLTAEEVGAGIHERDGGENVQNGASVLDPAAFAQDGGPSIAERIHTGSGRKVDFRRADNRRIARMGALGGWDQLRARLKGEDGRPMIYFMDNCTHAIRTLPALQHDDLRPEDVDTEAEDHAPDEIRYACMSRPYLRKDKPRQEPTFPGMAIGNVVSPMTKAPTMSELWRDHDRERRADNA